VKIVITLLLGCIGFFLPASKPYAQHLRIFACAIANDSAGAFMGGSSNGSGLYQSDDTGKAWKHLGWDNIKCYSMDMVQSSNGRILYVAAGLGVLCSTDFGEHWKQLTDWRISEALDVAINQNEPSEVWVATAHGPWETKDHGKSWESLRYRTNKFIERIVYVPGFRTQHWFANDEGVGNNEAASFRKLTIKTIREKQSIKLEGSVNEGVKVNGIVTLPLRQIWTLKSFLVTP